MYMHIKLDIFGVIVAMSKLEWFVFASLMFSLGKNFMYKEIKYITQNSEMVRIYEKNLYTYEHRLSMQ
jgi:hypothetical protein